MLLSDLIGQLSDAAAADEALIRVGDLALLAELRTCAEADGLDVGAYTARAVARYASEASGDDWVTLMGAMNRARDPALVFLRHAIAHAASPGGVSA